MISFTGHFCTHNIKYGLSYLSSGFNFVHFELPVITWASGIRSGEKQEKKRQEQENFSEKGGNKLQVPKIFAFRAYLEKSFYMVFFFILRNFLEVTHIVINFKGHDEFEDKSLWTIDILNI